MADSVLKVMCTAMEWSVCYNALLLLFTELNVSKVVLETYTGLKAYAEERADRKLVSGDIYNC